MKFVCSKCKAQLQYDGGKFVCNKCGNERKMRDDVRVVIAKDQSSSEQIEEQCQN